MIEVDDVSEGREEAIASSAMEVKEVDVVSEMMNEVKMLYG